MAEIVGTDQNDTLEGTAGDDIITGLAGIDTLSLAAQASADSTFSINSEGRWVVSSAAGQDSLSGIEQVQFSDGVVLLGENETRINTTTADVQYSSMVAGLADGGYVVTWSSNGQDGSGSGIYAQRYAANGSAVGAETRINTTTLYGQDSSTVAGLADGGYVVTWSSDDQDGSLSGIYAQRYAADGSAVGAETRINTPTFNTEYRSTVAALADGGYVVTWSSYYQDGSYFGVYAQRYAADGSAVGAETRINTTTANHQLQPTVAALADGGYVVTWSSYDQDGSSWGVYAQRYAADGSAVGAETRINTATADVQFLSTVAALTDGGYVVTWTSYGQDGSGYGIYAQRYAADGSAVGAETRINTTTADEQYLSTVAALADGGYVVTWSSNGQDGSSYGVYAQRFDANGMRASHPTLTGGSEDNLLRVSAAQGVEIDGGAGNDTLAGGSHGDILSGGSGADTFEFASSGNGVDRITDFAAGDRIVVAGAAFANDPTAGNGTSVGLNEVQVSAANGITKLFIGTDATPGADVVIELNGTWTADQLWSLGGNQIEQASPGVSLTGTTANDSLVGSAGNDTINGGAGTDTMAGGLRNDTYIVDNRNDVVVESANEGIDQVLASASYTLAANVENLTLTGASGINATGNALNNVIVGNGAANIITGGLGADTLTGGLGADRFTYTSTAESRAIAWDVIVDFVSGVDRIDLSKIDANVDAGGNQAFTWKIGPTFSDDATGQLRFDSATHKLYGSTNADATAEIVIQLTGVETLTAADIVL